MNDLRIIEDYECLFTSQVVLWGAGECGYKLSRIMKAAGMNLIGFVDSNVMRYGEKCNNYPIIKLEELGQLCNDNKVVIIISIDNIMSVKQVSSYIDNSAVLIPQYVGTVYAIYGGLRAHADCRFYTEEFQKRNFVYQKCMDWSYEDLVRINKERLKETLEVLGYDEPILVYQGGKVGSSSIFRGIKNLSMPVAHIHYLNDSELANVDIIRGVIPTGKVINIITGVREPISWSISGYIHLLRNNIRRTAVNIFDDVIEHIRKDMKGTSVLKSLYNDWFASEIKEIFDIDVYGYPFDINNGYCIIEKDNIRVFLYKMEKLHQLEHEIGEFIGNLSFRILNDNTASEYITGFIGEEIKNNIQVPNDIIDYYYQNDKVRHFYSENELDIMYNKYKTK